jgi:hypothetical protein
VIKRKLSFAMLACLLVAMVILMAVPMAASAAIVVTGTNWYGTTYVGHDDFYGTDVNAFVAGSNAKVAFNIQNTFDYDVNIKGVTVKFDWGDTYTATSFPATLAHNQGGVVLFDFTVPSTAGINATTHSYQLEVAYESADAPAIVTSAVTSATGTGIANQVVTLTATPGVNPVAPNSVVVYVNGGLWTSGFSPNLYSGTVTFTTAVTLNQNITIYWKYGEKLFDGNGSLKAGYLNSIPVASVDAPFIRDEVALQNNPVAADGYTANLATGRVALTAATAPQGWQHVFVSYVYYPTWSDTGTGVAVYTADQADAMHLEQKLSDLDDEYSQGDYIFPSTAGTSGIQAAYTLWDKADEEYAAGDFANAKTDYQAALDKLTAAQTGDAALNSSVETALTGLLTNAGTVVDGYGAKLNAEAKASKGQASMYKDVGIFTIMLGVAVLLFGIAGIIWAFSRYVDARGPAHHEHV